MATVFANATFHTMEDPEAVCRSITVEHGVITAVDAQPAPGDRIVDLEGRHAYPAMIDAHLHMLEAIVFDGVGVPLCAITDDGVVPNDLAGIERIIREHARTAKRDSIMVFSNCISAAMQERRLPNRFELDEWTGGASAWVLNIDGHSSSCSTKLLEQIGIENAPEDGILAGPAHDANLGAFTEHLASCITPSILAQGIARFCNECASYGIGTVCGLQGTDDSKRDKVTETIAMLAQRFPLDVRLFPQYMDRKKLDAVVGRMGRRRVGGCMKWELDGSVGSRTAAFEKPYLDGAEGSLYFEDEELERTISAFDEEGYLVSAHAIGERAIDQLVAIYEKLPGRHRIDHCEFPRRETVERIVELSPFVTIQPGYAFIDKNVLHGYETFLDRETIEQQIPLKEFAERGVTMCGSSDAPVQSVDPYLQMRGMREFYLADQSLSAFEALKTYTVNGGEMLGEKKGLLKCGWEASFFTTDEDLLTIEASALSGMRAHRLYLHGKPWKQMPESFGTLFKLLLTKPREI